MKIIKKIVDSIAFKSIVLTILPVVYSVVFPLAISISKESESPITVVNENLLKVGVVLLIIHIIVLIYYGVSEKRRDDRLDQFEKTNRKSPKEVKAAADLLKKYNKVIKDNADKVYEHVRLDHGHSDIIDWQWMESKGDEICEELHKFLKVVAERGDVFSVSIMFAKEENGTQGFTMMSRDSSDAATHTPRSYRNFVSVEEAEGTYYKSIFDDGPTTAQILMNKKEIKRKFINIGDVDYSQFVAIPISCKGKVVGVLQIAAYNNTVISNNLSEMKRLCNNYFSIAANTILLTDKVENVTQNK
ncbi:MAG: hypothetical protein ACI4GC_02880 [Acutalibacteraceae bacterium]